MSEPQLRAKVRRGLLKVEQLHALARAVYYGQRGAHQCPRGLRPGERVLVPDPDPRLHRLLAGPGRTLFLTLGYPARTICARRYLNRPWRFSADLEPRLYLPADGIRAVS